MAGEETNILHRVMKASSRVGARLFRQNTGLAWQGDPVKLPNGELLLKNPRPVRMGLCVGSSDTIGWHSVVITPDMIGGKFARFTAIEIKTKTGRVSPEQQTFIDAVREAGGIAGVARDEAEALALLHR